MPLISEQRKGYPVTATFVFTSLNFDPAQPWPLHPSPSATSTYNNDQTFADDSLRPRVGCPVESGVVYPRRKREDLGNNRNQLILFSILGEGQDVVQDDLAENGGDWILK